MLSFRIPIQFVDSKDYLVSISFVRNIICLIQCYWFFFIFMSDHNNRNYFSHCFSITAILHHFDQKMYNRKSLYRCIAIGNKICLKIISSYCSSFFIAVYIVILRNLIFTVIHSTKPTMFLCSYT